MTSDISEVYFFMYRHWYIYFFILYLRGSYMQTGFPTFDKNISEIRHGELIAFVERPAMGVNLLLNQLCFRMGDSYKICFFKFLTCKEYYQLPNFDEEYNVTVDNRILDFSELLLACAKQKVEKGLDVIIISNLYLLRTCSGYSTEKLLRRLKDMAKALQIAIIIRSYFKRRNKCKGIFPTIDDLNEYELLEYADKVISFYRPSVMCANKDLASYIKDGKHEIQLMPFKDRNFASSFKLYLDVEEKLICDTLDNEDYALFEHHIFTTI